MSVNPINVRLPVFELESEEGRQQAHRYLASGIVDLNQAIAALNGKLTPSTSNTTTIFESSGGGGGGGGIPSLGGVNDQIGQTAYTTQQSDNGAKIIVGDASPVTISLNNAVTVPWFTIIDNDSSSIASLVPLGGSLFGQNQIPSGGFGIVYFDGANWWCGATPLTSVDNSSIGVQDGEIYTKVYVDSGPPSFIPPTPGNPLCFDSSMGIPWHGYVFYNGIWNRFS